MTHLEKLIQTNKTGIAGLKKRRADIDMLILSREVTLAALETSQANVAANGSTGPALPDATAPVPRTGSPSHDAEASPEDKP